MIETQYESFFFNLLFWYRVALGPVLSSCCLSLNTPSVFAVSEFMSLLSLASPLPLLLHPDLEKRGNAGIPILFSCLWVVVGRDMWHASMWLIFHVKPSH